MSLGEFPGMLWCDGKVAVRQPPQPAAEGEGAVTGDQSSNGRASNHSLPTGPQSTGDGTGEFLWFQIFMANKKSIRLKRKV